jgi:tetratricopeptide (TPR) repeat protein
LLRQGKQLLKQQKWSEASNTFRRATIHNPEDSELYYWLGRSLEGQGNANGAIIAYKKAAKLKSQNPYVYSKIANVLLLKKEYSEAEDYYEKAFKYNPDHVESKVGLAKVAAHENKSKKVLSYLEGIAISKSFAEDIHRLKGQAYLNLKNFDLASAEIKQALKVNSKQALLWNQLGATYYAMARYKDANNAYQKALALKNIEQEFVAHLGQGKSLYALKNYDAAKKSFQKAARSNTEDIESRKYLAKINLAGKDYSGAEKYSRQALGITSNDAELYFILGYALEKQKKYSQAAQAFALGLKKDSKNESARLAYARSLVKSNKKPLAIDVLESLAKDKPQNDSAWEILSYLYTEKKDWKKAEEAVLTLHSLQKPTVKSSKILAVAQYEQASYAKAEGSLNKAIALNTKDNDLYFLRAKAKTHTNKPESAIKDLEIYTKNDPKDVKGQLLLANLYNDQKNYAKAYQRYQRVNALKPNIADAWVKRAQIDQRNKKPDLAVKHYKMALKYDGKNAQTHFDLGKIYYQQKQYKAAERELKSATILDSKKGLYYAYLGHNYYVQKQYAKSVPAFENAKKYGQDSNLKVNEQLGHAYVEVKNYKNAVSPLNKAIEVDANSLISWKNLGYAYKYQSRWSDAAKAFSKANILSPKDEKILEEKAAALAKAKQVNEAVAAYQDLIQLNPEKHKAHYELGVLYEDLKDYALAQKNYLKALKLSSSISLYKKSIVTLAKKQNDQQDITDAKQALLGYYAIDKNNSEVNYMIGQHYYDDAKYNKSIEFLDQAVKIKPNYWEAQKTLGMAWLKKDDLNKAQAALEKAARQNNSLADVHWNIGLIKLRNKQIDQAAVSFQKATLLDSKNARYHYDYARSLKYKKQWSKASKAISRSVRYASKNKDYWMLQADIYKNMDKHKDAAKSYARVANLDSTDEKAWLGYAESSSEINKWSDAIKGYEKAVALNSKKAESFYGLGNAYANSKKTKQAINALERALEVDSNYAQAYALLGEQYMKMEQKQLAQKAYEGARKNDAKDAQSRLALVGLYSGKNDLEKRKQVLEELTKLDSKNAEYWYQLGDVEYKLNKNKDALSALSKAVALDKGYGKAYYKQALSYLNLGQKNNALNALNKAIVADRKFAAPHYEKAKLLKDSNSSGKITALKKAIALKKDYVDAHRDLGDVYYKMGNIEAASKSYKNVLRYKENDKDAVVRLSEYYVDKGDYSKSIDLLKDYIEAKPSDAQTRYRLAKVYYDNDQKDESARELDRALVDRPDFAKAQILFGLILLEQKDIFGAQERFDRARRISPDQAEIYYGLGVVAKENGKPNDAIQNLEKAVQLNDKYQEAYLVLGDLYKAKGMEKKASEAYGKSAQVKSLTDLKVR